MSQESDLSSVLREMSPRTRRQFLKWAAAVGAATALPVEVVRNPMVVTAGPSPRRGGTVRVTGHHEISSLSPDDAGPTVHWVIVTQIHNALLEGNEYNVIERVLAETRWNLSKAARILDIDRTTLYNKIRKYGLREPAGR